METKPACHQCFLRQASDAAKRLNLSAARTDELLATAQAQLQQPSASATPPIIASDLHAMIRHESGCSDPYLAAKQSATEHALSLYPKLKQLLADADDPLDTAIRLAIAGNIIDLGVADAYDLEASIERVIKLTPAINHLPELREALSHAEQVLYLADNAGETVLDRLLIEQLELPVTYVVKGGATVNDATRDDALAAGLDQACEIIDNGAASMGTLLERCSAEFRNRFDRAELIIAKGMANFESLSGSRSGLFFLLQAKCGVVADHLSVAEKSIIILQDQAETAEAETGV
ncbi:hypothetical protein BOW53_07705 [Solemya pervernicosa gill symbiont]|uniref:Damage-control phosphatase ARMT1-like metal-binding domain-containing protein n=2 Tax=Gammaproteobacteria incertae sedis TaxID=118884 RepID=A0A1T2L5T2_9GAMM|nr:ARMT1-like domain-containing protein [Candidatus Reidiella endopervernicosa]OOZ40449.1 hypothetical protein BOW53_07705 [Solemya pervernicosa gill symbiont]QKQ25364.1 DUF89 family protein [Candidatus Reidiella endopervernicosa]